MILAHKIALRPNNKQATHLARAAAAARFAYNWALAEWKRQYEAGKRDAAQPKPSQAALRRRLNALKREQFPWMLNVTKNAPQMAIIQLGEAFKHFFAGRSGYPAFRKKGVHDRFTLTNDPFRIDGCRLRIPKLGWVRMRESPRFAGTLLSAAVSRVADRWFVSITVDTADWSHRAQAENQGPVGVDGGVSAFATLSTGEKIVGPKPHTALLKRIRRLSRRLSRKQKGSANRKKAKAKLAKGHARVANIRRDALHQFTSEVTRRHPLIGIEDLNVKGMTRNGHLARSISDMGWYEGRRQLEYKADRRGGQVIVADRWYASTKTCSTCHAKNSAVVLGVEHWACPACGAHHDRDINAATNLRNRAVSSTVSACGEEGAGSTRKSRVKPAPVKQEVSSRLSQ